MHSTKTEILAHLKRNDGSTVDGIASSLQLAPMTVRQHLVALERDGAVQSHEVRRATGRPHFRYTLTPEGNRRLSDGYDRLVALLVEQAGVVELNGQGAQARRADLFRAAARALAQAQAPQAASLGLADRAAFAVGVLRQHGSFAEHVAGAGATPSVEIRDFGCVYRETVSRSGPCAWHQTFLEALFGETAAVHAIEAPGGCTTCCQFTVVVAAASEQMLQGMGRSG